MLLPLQAQSYPARFLSRSCSYSRRFSKTKSVLVVRKRLSYDYFMPEKNKAAQELGRLGGSKGGKARAANMTKEERSEAARKAVNARWAKWRQERQQESQ